VISAPAGFGKTTTIGQWIADHSYAAAWLSLDVDDNDPQRFISYVIAALRTIHPELTLPSAPPPGPPVAAMIASVVHDLADIQEDYLLVLDDYHVITNSAIHDAMSFLLEHAPPSLHIVLTTRADPPFPLARLRVRGELVEIRAADLRFTPTEIAGFFNELMKLNLTDEQIRLLAAKTEGWAAGMQMAAISLKGRTDVVSFLSDFSGADRYVLDYLLEEVLTRLDRELQEALMALSVVDRFNARLFEALIDNASGSTLVADLERNNLFLIPLDNHREWYRFHHLFADLLRHRLIALYPARVNELNRRAAVWYEHEGMIEIALTHWRSAHDLQGLAGFIDRHWRRLLSNTPVEMLSDDIEKFDPTDRTPRLAIVQAWGMLHKNITEGISELVEHAITQLEGDQGRDVNDVRGHGEAVLALVARNRADAEGMIRHGERALMAIPDRRPNDSDYVWLVSHGVLRSLIGDAWHALGHIAPALEAFEKAIAIGRTGGDLRTVQIGTVNRARELILAGRLREGAAALDDIDELVSASKGFLSELVHQRQWSARLHLLRGELDSASEQIERAIALDTGRIGYRVEAHRIAATIALLADDRSRAEEHLRHLEGLPIVGGQERFSLIAPALRAQVALYDGNHSDIERWTSLFAPGADADRVQRRAFNATQRERALYARGLVALGREEEGMTILEDVEREYSGHGNLTDRLDATVGRVNALERLGRKGDAENLLEQTLAAVADERIVLPFAMARHELKETLSRLDRKRTTLDPRVTSSFLLRVTELCGLTATREAPHEKGAPAAHGTRDIPQLTSREQEILRLMAMGLSNQKIADRLYLSVNTIKTHASNLFDKLGASSRIEALMIARETGVIEQ